MNRRLKWVVAAGGALSLLAAYAAASDAIPAAAAGALLHPARRPVRSAAPAGCRNVSFHGLAVTLGGWRCNASGVRCATLIFLHGVGDNRESVAGAVDRFRLRGFDVVAYDSRAQGESTGDSCTYGYWEKLDLQTVIGTVPSGPIVLLGTSLGAAVALEEAADDSRVTGVVAAEVFSDLRTIARERAPRLLTERMIQRAFTLAETQGRFRIHEVTPVEAARRITVPVLLIHGAADTDTPPDHSRRVLAALAGPKELLLVPGARHNESLHDAATWERIDRWVNDILRRR